MKHSGMMKLLLQHMPNWKSIPSGIPAPITAHSCRGVFLKNNFIVQKLWLLNQKILKLLLGKIVLRKNIVIAHNSNS
jgi:hypothetical protein